MLSTQTLFSPHEPAAYKGGSFSQAWAASKISATVSNAWPECKLRFSSAGYLCLRIDQYTLDKVLLSTILQIKTPHILDTFLRRYQIVLFTGSAGNKSEPDACEGQTREQQAGLLSLVGISDLEDSSALALRKDKAIHKEIRNNRPQSAST